MDEHLKILKQHGKCWWGRVSPIAQDRADALLNQIKEGKTVMAFLHCTHVPKKIHDDGRLWYRAQVIDIEIGTPEQKELIPEYYRSADLSVAFLLKNIEPLEYEEGKSPKVPGQASVRYVDFKNQALPEKLFSLSSPDAPLCYIRREDLESELEASDVQTTFAEVSSQVVDVKDSLLEAQQQIIDLQNEVLNLRTYREQLSKILGVDYFFQSESMLEEWLVGNIQRVFPALQIIDRQPHASWPDGKFGRMDLLAMNRDTRDLTIIEVKTWRRAKKSGYDQFLRYTSWARNSLNALTEKYSFCGLRPTSELEFVIITDHADEEMKAICKDHGIKLVRLFGGLGFELLNSN